MSVLRKFWSPMVWGNLLAMALVATLLLAGVWYGLAEYTHHGEEIEIPDVTGRLYADAIYELERQGLTAEVVDSIHDRTKPTGAVLMQRPASGGHVKAGRTIELTINSRHEQSVLMPDIADNCSVREAQDRLSVLGFRTTVEEIDGDKDWVYGVKCQGRQVYAGDRVPSGANLILQVGSGYSEDADSMEFNNEGFIEMDYDFTD
ncbi:MAG: PASTA domain-containing protein [Bacteroidaceae bacterium]|nr:PASTA domain-containing protein [Bacteroidaceae bacterium]